MRYRRRKANKSSVREASSYLPSRAPIEAPIRPRIIFSACQGCERKGRDTSAAAESPPINAGHYTIDSASFHRPADTFSHHPAAEHTRNCNLINRQRNSTSHSTIIFISVFPFPFYNRSLLPDSYFFLFSSVIFFYCPSVFFTSVSRPVPV